MTTLRLSFAAALMCGAMALPAAAAGADAAANSNVTPQAQGSLGTPSTPSGVNGGISPSSPQDQTAMNAHGNMAADTNVPAGQANSQANDRMNGQMNGQTNSQASGQASADTSSDVATNESAIRNTGGDTSQKYSAKTRNADNQKEAGITAQLNQTEAQMASSGGQNQTR